MKKDVMFLCQFFYPEYISSATLPFDTAQYLSKNGYSVGVLCGYPKEYWEGKGVPKRENVDGIDIKRINYVQLDRSSVVGRVVNYFSFVVSVFFRMKEVKEYKVVFVYSNPPLLPLVALMCKKLYGTKIVFISYDVYPELAIKAKMIKENGLTAKFFKMLNKRLIKETDKIVAVSEDMKTFFMNTRKVLKEKVCVIPNWYEDCLEKEYVKTQVLDFIPNDVFVISYLGNLGTCQDADIIFKIADLLREEKIYIIIAGHGNKMNVAKDMVLKSSLEHVYVLPFLHGDDYETVLKRSDAFWVTLIPGLEGLCAPSKTYAYLMSGKPVIVSMEKNMEIAQDILSYGAGIVTSDLSNSEIVKKIIEVKTNVQIAEKMKKNARELYERKYEKSVCLEKYIKLMEELKKTI